MHLKKNYQHKSNYGQNDSGSCKKGHLYARQYGYCLHYFGQLTANEGTDTCRVNGEELIKVDSREESVFVSGLACK